MDMDENRNRSHSTLEVDVQEGHIQGFLVGNNDLILERVFGFLKLEDIKSCRLVNSKWLDISQSKFNELSVIRIQYDNGKDQGTTVTAGNFLTEFKDSPLCIALTGVSIRFEGLLTFQWKDDPIIDFLKKYGSQVTYLKLEVVNGVPKGLNFFAFKNILAELTPQLKQLCCDIHMSDGDFSPVEFQALVQAFHSSSVTLPKLAKLGWSTIPDDWWDFTSARHLRNIFTPLFMDLLTCSPNLTSILTEGSSLNFEAFDFVPETTIVKIKEITIDPQTSLHQLHIFFNKLTELSKKNLKLSSLSVVAFGIEEHWPLWKEALFDSLLKFLNSQKECLQKLTFHVPIFDSPFLYKNLPRFPKMSKLTHLDINCSRMFLRMLIGGSHNSWNDVFPVMKVLQFSYDDYLPTFCEEPIPKMILKDTVNLTVKIVRLHPKSSRLAGSTNSKADIANMVNQAYDYIKSVFNNMTLFQLIDERNALIHLFHGSKDNYRSIGF